jgi:hypothetical protein
MEKRSNSQTIILAMIVVAFIIFLAVQTAAAHTEGKLQLAAVTAGPYQLSVWTSPDPTEIGEVHVAVSVVLAEDASPVLDATVLVQMTELDSGTMLSSPATTEDSENKFLYEAVLSPDMPGTYEVEINVGDNHDRSGEASFVLEVEGRSGFNPLYYIPIAILIVGGTGLILFRRQNNRVRVNGNA